MISGAGVTGNGGHGMSGVGRMALTVSPAAKLCGFLLLLAVIFIGAYAAGAHLGPVTVSSTTPGPPGPGGSGGSGGGRAARAVGGSGGGSGGSMNMGGP